MNKIWQVRDKKYNDVIKQLLYNRGISVDNKSVGDFLDPDFDRDFHDPELLPDFGVAIKRICQAIKSKEKIGIFADYDADGIPGAALLYKTLKVLGCQPVVYIPTRSGGYGFNKSGIDYLISAGGKLIISVDLGIREFELSEYIKKKGCDLIITDHHEPAENPPAGGPKALAVINSKTKFSKYPFRELCGAGVVFKIVQGLSKYYPKIIDERFLKWNLDLVAISTISDVVPLIDENRIIAKFGLKVLRKTKNIGLQKLYSQAKILAEKIDAYTVGFQIGPRINAPGRIDHATGSFEILITDDKKVAENLATHLDEQNQIRQDQMEKIFSEAVKEIEKNDLIKNKIIILFNKHWQKGVIGPVANRIVEKYMRPTILFTSEKSDLSGSARSISGFNIIEALENCKKYLTSFGGHTGAAGVHLKEKNFQKFSENIISFANKNISDELLLAKIMIDLVLDPKRISIGQFKNLEKLEPFGLGNPRPVFLTENLELISHRTVGKENKHLQLRFKYGKSWLKGVIFNHDLDLQLITIGNRYDVVYVPKVNFWNGAHYIDLQIIDIKKHEK
ncbi:MAG: single-stranded-DNA-specific exonuclease [Candidatus Berkelbacteria bacterium Athens1014_28]|uniref:Single-stranded-DNA-specific exonuclease RecJ n=1 Tax=Candidatus Berkelbacteria bacterium Athens1014_28 TaxID=2017145 RepID=A0A554LQ88_9BACT|nr:MAG: single-stranded-DNA-specific exonuclease [Candidatus Berkelbacteria bacterium Athens1014_28]